MIFQNSDVVHLRTLAQRRGHWHVATTLRLLGVPFEDTFKILFGCKPRSRVWEGLVWLRNIRGDRG